ncbi:RND family efflux transporter, MFP subunit [Chitinophaga costaii]|uniref:RND family efflux transporter, MFP subunit n=1 Tax=Chitinophaga costaii TaxID=1335309 RepID=A0A1C4DH20_9BACT|nr:efflux RND transporter periplasmic adaptor subunit [Chitinophaga costaii]SCC30593.1 RND family efflux transporter, MFP subunit [Chitinophaga costaii]
MRTILLLSLTLIFCASCGGRHGQVITTPSQPKAPAYTVVEATAGSLSRQMTLPGQLAAYEEVSIFPKVNGYVQQVLVDIGSPVKKGALLMTLEAPELEQACLQAKEKYATAKADCSLSSERYARLQEAAQTAGAVSPLDITATRTKAQADSALANAAYANWQMQETLRSYLRVTAPFDGVITQRNVHPGALVSDVSKDKPMLELKSLQHLRLQVDVPEAVAGTLSIKDTLHFRLSAFPGLTFNASISRKSGNMNLQYRAERIEADVPNPKQQLSAGMYADVLLDTHANAPACIVPNTAVVTSTDGRYVLLVSAHKARRTAVTTGNSQAGSLEVYGNIHPGDRVIAHANDEIPDGTVVE